MLKSISKLKGVNVIDKAEQAVIGGERPWGLQIISQHTACTNGQADAPFPDYMHFCNDPDQAEITLIWI